MASKKTTDQEIQTLITAYGNATAQVFTAVLEKIKNLVLVSDKTQGAELEGFINESAYQGFDPKLIAFVVISLREEDLRTRIHDVEKMIITAVERGNNVKSIQENSTEEFKIEIQRLVDVYNIKSKSGKSRSAITFSRVAMAFPMYTCEYMLHARSTTVPYAVMESLSHNYPKQMMTSAFGSLIPAGQEPFARDLLQAHCLHQLEFTRIVSKKDPSTPEKMVEDVIRFAEAAINGSYIDRQVRIDILLKWKLIKMTSDNKSIYAQDVVKKAAKCWRSQHEEAKK